MQHNTPPPLCCQLTSQAKCAKQDQKTKLAGLAHALLCNFHGVGYQVYDPELPRKVIEVVSQMRFDPANFTRIPKSRHSGPGCRRRVSASIKIFQYPQLGAAVGFGCHVLDRLTAL